MEAPAQLETCAPPTDAVLLGRFAAGEGGPKESEAAFAEVVARHSRLVYVTARRVLSSHDEAQDVSQKVFTLLAQKVRRGLAVRDSVAGWLHRVAVNCSREALRARRTRTKLETAAAALEAPQPQDTALASLLDEALTTMPEPDRDLILRRYGEGLSCRELSAETGKSEAAVQKQAVRALEKLAARLRQRGVIVPAATISAIFGTAGADKPLAAAELAAHAISAAGESSPGSVISNLFAAMKLTKFTAAAALLAFLTPLAVGSRDHWRAHAVLPQTAASGVIKESAAGQPAPNESFPHNLLREIAATGPNKDMIRFLKLASRIGGLQKDELPILWQALAARSLEGTPRSIVRILFSRWAELDAAGALSAALAVQGGIDPLTDAWHGVAAVLVPQEGKEFFSRLYPNTPVPWEKLKAVDTPQDAALAAGLEVLAQLKPAEATEILYRMPSLTSRIGTIDFSVMYAAATSFPDAVWSELCKLPDSGRRDAMIRGFCESLYNTTPATGVKLLAQPGNPPDAEEYLAGMLAVWELTDPGAAAAFREKILPRPKEPEPK